MACTRPVIDNATICGICGDELAAALRRVASFAADLDTVRAKLTRYGGQQGGSRSAERPLVVDLRVRDVEWDAVNTLAAWSAAVGWKTVTGPVRLRHLAVHLAAHVNEVRRLPDAGQAVDEVGDVERRLLKLVDRPPERWFAGPCDGCREDMYATAGDTLVRCPTKCCGQVYDVAKRRQWLLDAAENHLATAVEVARAIVTLGGVRVTAHQVRAWAQHDRLEVRAKTPDGRDLFRVGDVLDVVNVEQVREASKRRRRPRKVAS